MRVNLIIFLSFILMACARQTQPTGGPKDTDPPQLIFSNPENGQKNFRGNQIELTFDELIKVKDPKEEILITPSLGANTKFTVKKNRVLIIPEFNFLDSTTYGIAFRDGIQDINEGNPADDLHLAFSTGPIIDSLKLFGYVTEAFQDKIPEKITVGIYQSDTFDIFKHKPSLFTKADKKARFTLPNLKPGQYYIYAFDDKNKNQRVDSKSERFGFISSPISLPANSDSIHLELIHLDARPIKLTSIRNSNTISIIRFNKAIDSINIKAQTPIIYTFGDMHSEIILYKDFNKSDSIKVNVFATDSINQTIDTVVYAKYTDNKIVDEKFKFTKWEVNFEAETNTLRAETNCNKLLLSINYDSIYIQIDTTTFQSITQKDIIVDTLIKKVRLNTKLKIESDKKLFNPILVLGKGAFVSINNDSSKTQEIQIKTLKPEETGTVSTEINTKEKHFQIQLTNTDRKVIKSFRDLKKYTFTYLTPGDYKISIFVDANNNGKWDPGDFYKKIESEKTKIYRTMENKSSFPIRANWELGPLLIAF